MLQIFQKNIGLIIGLLLSMLLANSLALSLPLGLKFMIDSASAPNYRDLLGLICLGLLSAIVLKSILQTVVRRQTSLMTQQMVNDLSKKVYAHALRLSLLDIQHKKAPQIISHLTADMEHIKLFSLSEAMEGLYSSITIVAVLMILGWMKFELMLIALAVFLISAFFLLRIVPQLKMGYTQYKEAHQKAMARAQEALTAMSIVKISHTIDFEKKKFQEQLQESSNTYLNNQRLHHNTIGLVELLLGLGLIAMLFAGAYNLQTWQLTTGTLAAFYSYVFIMFAPLLRLGGLSGSFHQARVSWERVQQFLETPLQYDPPTIMVGPQRLHGALQTYDLSFYYPHGPMTLDKICLSVIPGQTLGIVGPSGAGKTTLVHLLTGLLSPVSGTIRIDGWDLRNIDKKLLAENVSVVFQDEHLFSMSIMDNIRYGAFDVSDQEIYAAARAAKASDFIEDFKEGFQTVLFERGLNLSGGQRQRIALARALVRKPKILILDEATCALDALTENEVQKSIRQFCPEAAIIAVAHRFSTIMDADRILVLQEGRILEQGDHNYLLSRKGLYSTLYFEQFKNT